MSAASTDTELPQRLAQAATASVAAERATRCPAELLLAQWAIESSWGENSPRNNCFGIKLYRGCPGGGQLLTTREWFTAAQMKAWRDAMSGRTATPTGKQTGAGAKALLEYQVQDWFACFDTLGECFTQRASLFFSGPYAPHAQAFLRNRDWTKPATADPAFEALLTAICPIYATDPTYTKLVGTIANQSNIRDAIARARSQEPGVRSQNAAPTPVASPSTSPNQPPSNPAPHANAGVVLTPDS